MVCRDIDEIAGRLARPSKVELGRPNPNTYAYVGEKPVYCGARKCGRPVPIVAYKPGEEYQACSKGCMVVIEKYLKKSERKSERRAEQKQEDSHIFQQADKTQQGTRICLGGCNKPFWSEGPWNRVCPNCGERNIDVPPRARKANVNLPRGKDIEEF